MFPHASLHPRNSGTLQWKTYFRTHTCTILLAVEAQAEHLGAKFKQSARFFSEFYVGVSHHVTMIYDKRKNHSQTQPCSKQGASERMGWKISTNGLMFPDKCFIIKASEWLDNSCFQKQGLNISAWLETKINTSFNYLVYRNIYMNKKVVETWFLFYSRCNK